VSSGKKIPYFHPQNVSRTSIECFETSVSAALRREDPSLKDAKKEKGLSFCGGSIKSQKTAPGFVTAKAEETQT